MDKKNLKRFLDKNIVITYWDRDNKEQVTYYGKVIDIETEFIVVDYYKYVVGSAERKCDGIARIFIGDLRDIFIDNEPKENEKEK